jgi:hypothetical protein
MHGFGSMPAFAMPVPLERAACGTQHPCAAQQRSTESAPVGTAHSADELVPHVHAAGKRCPRQPRALYQDGAAQLSSQRTPHVLKPRDIISLSPCDPHILYCCLDVARTSPDLGSLSSATSCGSGAARRRGAVNCARTRTTSRHRCKTLSAHCTTDIPKAAMHSLETRATLRTDGSAQCSSD